VADALHARFDAIKREYKYYIDATASPFNVNFVWHLQRSADFDLQALNQAAKLIASYESFFPFCKAGSDVEHYNCRMFEAHWSREADVLVFTISANRFLRGMVRLIVGACVHIMEGKIGLEDLKNAMEEQSNLPIAYSVPAQGLFLHKIDYGPNFRLSEE